MKFMQSTLLRHAAAAQVRSLIAFAIFPVLAGGCSYPVLSHGPHPEPGVTLDFQSGVIVYQTDTPSVQQKGGFDFALGFGAAFRPDDWNGGAAKLSAQAGFYGGAIDAYFELPESIRRSTELGAGVMAMAGQRSGVMPYVMAGRRWGRAELFVAQGIGIVRPCRNCVIDSPNPVRDPAQHLLSVTTFGIGLSPRHRDVVGDLHWYVTLVLGRQDATCASFGFGSVCTRPQLMAGMSSALVLRVPGFREPGPKGPPDF